MYLGNQSFKLIDISPLISEKLAVFPGDTKFNRKVNAEIKGDNNFALSEMTTSTHIGAHTDAPNHYIKNGLGIGERDLNFYIGQCQVFEVDLPRGQRISVKDIESKKIETKRVLFKTNSFPNPDIWNDDFVALSPELIEFLANAGVILVGIDTPSIDPAKDAQLLSHNVIAKKDMAILEGIVLKGVKEGSYQLLALPLKIKGADASPVRAVLLEETQG